MNISLAASAIMVFLTSLLPASCHKETDSTNKTALASGATNTAVLNLGEIVLTNMADTCLQLPNGRTCIMTPKWADSKNVRITIALSSENKYGETRDYSVLQITARPGDTTTFTFESLNFVFTPKIFSESAK